MSFANSRYCDFGESNKTVLIYLQSNGDNKDYFTDYPEILTGVIRYALDAFLNI